MTEKNRFIDSKMLVMDMDDTLLKDDLTISRYNIEQLQRYAQNATIVLASGRDPFGMTKYFGVLGLDKKPEYAICANGTYIIRTDTKEVVYKKTIERALAMQVYAFADALGLPLQTYVEGTIHLSFENDYTEIDAGLTGMNNVVEPDYRNWIGKSEINKIVIADEPEKLVAVMPQFKEKFGEDLNIFISKPYFLEIMPQGTDKGTALKKLAEKLGFVPGEIVAVGDAMNDAGMIKYAGTGVAMANAVDEIKGLAQIVLDYSNEEDGVGRLVDEYLVR